MQKTSPEEIIGKKVGTLTPISSIPAEPGGRTKWKCICDCGRETLIPQNRLIGGKQKTCGHCSKLTGLFRDLTGKTYGALTVLERAPNIGKRTAWHCKCGHCGSIKIIKGNALVTGNSKSCGCQINYNKINLSGKIFGRLTVIEKFETNSSGNWSYLCKCSCGNESVVCGSQLTRGATRSCGCLAREMTSKRAASLVREKNPRWMGGVCIDNDGRKSKEYNAWRKAVKKKDKFCCQVCGDTKDLEIHHLDSYVKFPEKRYEIDNGVCICQTCHQLFHIEFSYGDNTKSQFEQFKRSWGV